MNAWLELAAFAGVMALGQFSPGPDMILLTRTALAEGARAGAIMACGIASGLAVHTALAVGGLALAFERMPALRLMVAWLAAGYLLWLAGQLLAGHFFSRATTGATAATSALARPRRHRPYLRGLICNLLNPKAVLFLAAVSAPFLAGDRPAWWPAAIWSVVVFQGCLLWALWARLLQWKPLRSRYERAAKWIDATFAVALAALALRLLWLA
jgi:threonine/homoserine/homoserine lactone efflux protein